MIRLRYLALSAASIGAITTAGMGVVSAATNNTNSNGNVGASGIPRSVFKQERLTAESQVLNTSTENIQAAHKNKTLSQLIKAAGLTPKTYHQKLKAQLTSDLEGKGYSQDQVIIALQHKTIVHLRHQNKKPSTT